jgi:hypothetical protein
VFEGLTINNFIMELVVDIIIMEPTINNFTMAYNFIMELVFEIAIMGLIINIIIEELIINIIIIIINKD